MPPFTISYRLQRAASHLRLKSKSVLNTKEPPLEYDKFKNSFYITLPVPATEEVTTGGNALVVVQPLTYDVDTGLWSDGKVTKR